MPSREKPRIKAHLYDPGIEGIMVSPQYDHWDVPARSINTEALAFGQTLAPTEYVTSTRTTFPGYQISGIEVIRDLNCVVPRGYIVEYDTPKSQYNLFGGAWEDIKTLAAPRKSRLTQRSAAKNNVWRAESKYSIIQNAELAFTVERLKNRHDNNSTDYPSKVQVVISGKWTIRFSSGEDAGIYRYKAGAWVFEKSLDIKDTNKEYRFRVAVRRGCVCFTFDDGENWLVYRDATPLTIPSGQIVFEGVSCQASFGFHQVWGENVWYEINEFPLLENLFGYPVYDYTYTLIPSGTNVLVTPVSSPIATHKYRVALDVGSTFVANLSFNMFRFPEVYGILTSWSVVLSEILGLSYVDLSSIKPLVSFDLTEEEDISRRTGSIVVDHSYLDAITGAYGYRILKIALEYDLDDGSVESVQTCWMYIIQPEPSARIDLESPLAFKMTDIYLRAQKTTVDEGWRPLDGMTCVAARNYCLVKMGLPISRGTWYNSGLSLPNGLPDKELWKPSIGTSVDQVFSAIDAFEGTETFTDPNGQFTSRIARYTDASVSYTFDTEGATPKYRIKEIRNRAEHEEVKTAVIVKGRDLSGSDLWATSINYAIERNQNTTGFVGFRIWDRVDNANVINLTQALAIATYRRALQQNAPQIPEITVPGLPGIFRGMRCKIINAEMAGGGDSQEFRVEGINHKWEPTLAATVSNLRVRRIV